MNEIMRNKSKATRKASVKDIEKQKPKMKDTCLFPDPQRLVSKNEIKQDQPSLPSQPVSLLPPPPPPPAPPPPPPPPLSQPKEPLPASLLTDISSKDSRSSQKYSKPDRKQRNFNEENVNSNSGLDLNSIIAARKKLRTAKPSMKDSDQLTETTAAILQNALNKMKKYTLDSSDEERYNDSDNENEFSD